MSRGNPGYPLGGGPDIPIFHAIESRRVLHFDYQPNPFFWPASSRGEDRPRTCTYMYVYIHICVTWGFHAGISICKQGSILSSVALCKDSGSRTRRRRSSSIGERRWVDIRENGVNASFQRSVNFLIEKLAPLVGKFPVGTVYTRGNYSSALRIVRLSFYSKFLDDDCHIIKLNNVITV